MKKISFILSTLMLITISNYIFPCSPKQIWIPLKLINIEADYQKIGEKGNINIYKITVLGKFHPGTHGLELNCSYEQCCDIYDKIAKYRISYCINQPCSCQTETMLPSKCSDIPLASFCEPENALSCHGPHFHQFDDLTGNVSNPGLKGGCPNNNQLNCKSTDIPILEFEGTFNFELSKDVQYPYNLEITTCLVDGVRNNGECIKKQHY